MMKNNFFLLGLALLMTACADEPQSGSRELQLPEINVSFGASLPDTRAWVDVDGTQAGGITGGWESTDQIGVYATCATTQNNLSFAYAASGYFEGTLTDEGSGTWTYQAYYPHTALVGGSASGTTLSIPFGVERLQQGGAFNSHYDLLFTEPLSVEGSAGMANGSPVVFDFVRPLSVLDFDLSALADQEITFARLESLPLSDGSTPQLSAETLTFALTEGVTSTLPQLSETGRSPRVGVSFSGEVPSDVWYTLLPGNYLLRLDLINAAGEMASISIDRTSAPFEAGVFYYKALSGLSFAKPAAPSYHWPNEDIDAPHEITLDESGALTYDAAIEITAPAGIASLEVTIDSDYLENMLGVSELTLIPENMLEGILSGGDELLYATSTTFDISLFLPIIASDGGYGEHRFTVKTTDLAGQTTSQTLIFTCTEPEQPLTIASTYTCDLWKNTSDFAITTSQSVDGVNLYFKKSEAATWQKITATGDATSWSAQVAPTWLSTTNDLGKAVWYLDGETGVFAGHDYLFYVEALRDGEVVAASEQISFTTSDGDTFPCGCFEESSWKSNGVQFPGTSTGSLIGSGQTNTYDFWGSGYLAIGSAKNLCKCGTFGGETCAQLQAGYNSMLVSLPTPGNLFLGDFSATTSGGTVSFGKHNPEDFSTRPRALRVKLAAQLYKIQTLKWATEYVADTGKSAPTTEDYDQARIFVCLVDWSGQQAVFAGNSRPTGTWDPDSGVSVSSQGTIVAYASEYITYDHEACLQNSLTQLVEVELPLYYYDTTKADDLSALNSAAYNMVVSCATSALGDYMISSSVKGGADHNVLYVDDFEWVY